VSGFVPTSTAELLDNAAAHFGDKPFIVDDGRSVSFSELATDVQALARALVAEGFSSGDRAAIWAPNCAEWIIAALAIQYVGGTLVTVNTRYKASEARDIISDSGSSFAFVVDAFLGVEYAQSLARLNIDGLQHIITIKTPGTSGSDGISEWIETGTAAGDEVKALCAAQRESVAAGDVSDILFTSGTTGRAKGVVTTHGQNLTAFSTFADILGLDADDRYLIINPFFHSFGYKAGWLAALLKGAAVYPMAVFDVPAVLSAIKPMTLPSCPGPRHCFKAF